jgi:histidine phosphotransferase ChpT
VSLGDARDALEAFLKDSKTRLEWRAAPMILPKDTVKLALNLALAAMDSIPRGGVLKLSADDTAEGTAISVCAEGPMARLTDELTAALAGDTPMADLDGRRIQPFLTGLIARNLGGGVVHVLESGAATLSVNLPKQAAAQAAA